MIKNIKDYLHLYPKCSILICEPGIDPVSHYLEGYDWELDKAIAERVNYDPSWIKLILRPLSDMTEEEVKFICNVISAWVPDEIHKRIKNNKWSQWYYIFDNREEIIANLSNDEKGFKFYRGNDYFHVHLEIFQYLLKHEFDIFRLIDDGIAINKTTLK